MCKSRSAVICQNCVSRFMIHWRPMAFMFSQLTKTQKARLFELTSGSQPLIDPPPAASGVPPAQSAATGRDLGQARTGTVSEQGKDWSSHCRSRGWPRATPPPPREGPPPPKASPAPSQDQVRNRGPTAPQGDSREKSPEAPAAPRGAEQQRQRGPAPVPGDMPLEIVDSHFHLDRLQRSLDEPTFKVIFIIYYHNFSYRNDIKL